MAAKKAAAGAKKAKKQAAEPRRDRLTDRQKYELRKVADLVEHPRNANRGDRAAIGESIDAIGFYGAVIVQESTGYILAGNHRKAEAAAKGYETLPCIVIDCDEEEALRILGGDNRTTRLGKDDDAKVMSLMESWCSTERGLRGTGYQEADYLKLVTKLNPPERVPEFRDTVKHQYACPNCGHTWQSAK